MKHALFSIKPEHVVNIINGDKSKELRKTIPHDSLPFGGYIYCTKGKGYACVDKNGVASFIKEARYDVISRLGLTVLNGTVCASFTCDGFDVLHDGKVNNAHDEMLALNACVSPERIERYGSGNDVYALNLADVRPFTEPYPLSLMRVDKPWAEVALRCVSAKCPHSAADIPGADCSLQCCVIKRAPQSWQYVCKIPDAAR